MRATVLTPKGVRYDLDDAGRPPRWPWVLGCVLVVTVLAGLAFTLRTRISQALPQRRSQAVAAPLAPAPDAARMDPSSGSMTNSRARWPAALDGEIRHQLDGAEAVFRADDLASARRRYLELLERGNLGAAAPMVEQRVGEISMMLVLSPRPMPEKVEHVVASGESLDRIARQHGVTRELLIKANDIRHPDRLQPGQHLLVLDKPLFSITVDLHANALRLLLNGKLLKRYEIGTGRRAETPAGLFVIRSRQERPVWWHPDGRTIPYGHKDNILGTRWMSLQATGTTTVVKGYGIRGTWVDGEVGRVATGSGIRLHNPDVEELFLMVPEGTPVRITE